MDIELGQSITSDNKGYHRENDLSKSNITRRRLLRLFPFLWNQNIFLRHLNSSSTHYIELWNDGILKHKAIMEILRHSPHSDKDMIVYRGIRIESASQKFSPIYKQPFSTSLLPEVGAKFANCIGIAVIMKIHISAGTPFLWTGITYPRDWCHQAEIILPPGSLTVKNKEWQNIKELNKKYLVMECTFNINRFSRRKKKN